MLDHNWVFAAVVPSYGDGTSTPWIIGVQDEKDLDALVDLAREWNAGRSSDDDQGIADFIEQIVEQDNRFKVLTSAVTDGLIVLEID